VGEMQPPPVPLTEPLELPPPAPAVVLTLSTTLAPHAATRRAVTEEKSQTKRTSLMLTDRRPGTCAIADAYPRGERAS